MTWWVVGAVCNGAISLAYFLIVYAISVPLIRSRQLRSNAMGAATAAIFLTCAVHHGAHVVHMLMPYAGIEVEQGEAMRAAWGPELALWDLVGALVAGYYWTLRGGLGAQDTPQLFQDQHEREQRALELNDAVLQGMVVARMAIDLGDRKRSLHALDGAIRATSEMITELVSDPTGVAKRPLRSAPALVSRDQDGPDPAAAEEEPSPEGRRSGDPRAGGPGA